MGTFEERTKKKKEAIIQTAYSLFKQKGFSDTSIQEIAKEANVSQVSIYNYFGSKDALVLECVKIAFADIFSKAQEILDGSGSFIEKVQAALSLCSNDMNIKLNDYFSDRLLDDHKFLVLLNESLIDSKRLIYRAYIERGMHEGTIDKSLPIDLLVEYTCLFGMVHLDSTDYCNQLAALHHLYLYGIIKK